MHQNNTYCHSPPPLWGPSLKAGSALCWSGVHAANTFNNPTALYAVPIIPDKAMARSTSLERRWKFPHIHHTDARTFFSRKNAMHVFFEHWSMLITNKGGTSSPGAMSSPHGRTIGIHVERSFPQDPINEFSTSHIIINVAFRSAVFRTTFARAFAVATGFTSVFSVRKNASARAKNVPHSNSPTAKPGNARRRRVSRGASKGAG